MEKYDFRDLQNIHAGERQRVRMIWEKLALQNNAELYSKVNHLFSARQ